MRLPWFVYAGVGLVLLALGFAGGYRWQSGAVAKEQARTAELRATVNQVRAESAEALAKRNAEYQANNAQVRAEYAKQIADRDDRGRDLADRLLHATSALGRERAALEASDRSRAALASTFASREESLARAVGAYDAACTADAAQLDALNAQLAPQINVQ